MLEGKLKGKKNWPNENTVKVSAIIGSKNKLPGATETKNYAVIYTGVNR